MLQLKGKSILETKTNLITNIKKEPADTLSRRANLRGHRTTQKYTVKPHRLFFNAGFLRGLSDTFLSVSRNIMKKLILVIFLAFIQQAYAKEIPQYEFIKVWNFLKYYHPVLASGKIDADSLFLGNIEKGNIDINQSILFLTKNLKNNFTGKKLKEEKADILLINQNFDWYRKSKVISKRNKKLLDAIYRNRFIRISTDYSATDITNEKKYDFPKDENLPLKFRLLTLSKIIGAIDYLYPHKYLMNERSDEILNNLIQEAINCKSRIAFEIILAKAASTLEDTHTFKFYNELKFKREIFHTAFYAPFDFQVFKNYILITDILIPEFCEKANITIGDRITEINDKTISEMIDEKKKLLSISNQEGLLHRLSDYQTNLIWTDDFQTKKMVIQKRNNHNILNTEIELISTTDKQNLDKIVFHLKAKMQAERQHQLSNPNIAYFRIDQTFSFIENVEDDKVDEAMINLLDSASSKKAIIFDMRGYPDWGGFVYTYIYNYFSPEENYFGKYYQQNLNNIGSYIYRGSSQTYFPNIENKKTKKYEGKVFIIVNQETLSASEWNTMNLQHIFPQAITIGQKTAGADGDLKKIILPGNYTFEFTGNGIFYPNNLQTQKVGVKIDKMITYSDEEIITKKDIPFETILNLIE